ncbi:MAG: hypothetical protein PHH35_01560 [Candidatus Pacebacteria bacterium]|nr:hypothetical protein [Candidatus Paceibacterota bacterium]
MKFRYNTNMKKFLICLSIIIILGLGVFFTLSHFQANNQTKGTLRFKVHPLESIVKINNKTYQDSRGIFDINLSSGKQKLLISLPEYSFIEEEINIEPGKTLDLGSLFLFPNNWQEENIINSNTIENFYLTLDSNRIVFIEKDSDYLWYLFIRNSSEKELFWKTSTLPEEVVFSLKKTMLVNLGKNNWQIVFLPKSLIQTSISLTDAFKQALNNSDFKTNTLSREIIQADFYPQDDNYLVIRTEDALYLLEFLNREIEKIHDGPVSPFLLEESSIYFLKENGVLTKTSLQTKQEQQISLFSFESQDLEQTKIKKRKNQEEFLIIESSKKASYLKPPENIPVIIGENLLDASFSLDEKEILLNLKDEIEIYNTEQEIKYATKLFADIPAQWFLNNDYLLFQKDKTLNTFFIKENKIWPISANIKNDNFFYDPTINYVFYLSDQGVIKVSI